MTRSPPSTAQTEETIPEGLIGQGGKSAPPAGESIFRKMNAYMSRKGEQVSKKGQDKFGDLGKRGRVERQGKALKLGQKAQVVKQPGDGSCMYHSIAFGLNRVRSPAVGYNGPMLRQVAAQYLEKHAGDILPGEHVEQQCPTRLRDCAFPDVVERIAGIRGSEYGEELEMCLLSLSCRVRIDVYVQTGGDFERIWIVGLSFPTVISVVTTVGVHYDALILK